MSAAKTLLEQLRLHYIKPAAGAFPGGVFVPECGINGRTAQSRADALYVGFTSTSGRLLIGHEVKVSRADWRKELDTAGKADFWADNCHAWYIVAPGPEIVPAAEVPHGWGLMYPSTRAKTRMQVVVKATVHGDRVPSWDAVRSILSRLDTLRAQHDVDVRAEAAQDAQAKAEAWVERRLRDVEQTGMSPQQRERLDALDLLEEFLGRKVSRWAWSNQDGTEISTEVAAAAIRLAQSAGDLLGQERYATSAFTRLVEQMQKGLSAYDEARQALAELTGTATP